MDISNVVLCAPLQQLKQEHKFLRAEMDDFYNIAEEIEYESGPAVVQLFTELYKRISTFTDNLKAHSQLEDNWLFPMVARHLDENDKTIETMELEHKKAEQHLQDFLTEANEADSSIDENDAQYITVYAVQAYATLTQHFAKEETVLFPLAENLLSVDEKEELEQLFQT